MLQLPYTPHQGNIIHFRSLVEHNISQWYPAICRKGSGPFVFLVMCALDSYLTGRASTRVLARVSGEDGARADGRLARQLAGDMGVNPDRAPSIISTGAQYHSPVPTSSLVYIYITMFLGFFTITFYE